MKSQKWKAYLLTPEDATSELASVYESAYQQWHACWQPVYKQVGDARAFYSDQFTRQHEVLALFYEGKCAASVFFRSVDLSKDYARNDSYFAYWPEVALKKLAKSGNKILVCSFFTVMADFRKDHVDLSVKDLLMGMLVRRFLDSQHDAMTGTLRNSKGVNELCYKWGATPLAKDVPFFKELNDLVGFYDKTVKKNAVPSLTPLMDQLWTQIKTQTQPLKRAS